MANRTMVEMMEDSLDKDWATGETGELFRDDDEKQNTLKTSIASALEVVSDMDSSEVGKLLKLNKIKKELESSISLVNSLLDNIREYPSDKAIQDFRKTR